MFTQLWDKDALQRSMNKSLDREEDGFDHIRSGMQDIVDTVSLGKDIVKGSAQVYSDIMDAKDSVDRATSRQARTSSEAGLSIEGRGNTKVRKITQTTPPGHSDLLNSQTGIGASVTQVVGNSTAPPIQVKLGKQITPYNSIPNFLSLMNGSGSVSSSFGGRLLCAADDRVRCYNVFRHNLFKDGNLNTGGAYPANANIMVPSGNVTVGLSGGTNALATVKHSRIQDMPLASVWYANYNKADLEDLCWNLNKFKLGPQTDTVNSDLPTVSSVSPKIQLLDDVPVMQADDHRAYSSIYLNNSKAGIVPGPAGSTYTCAPYTYEAVFKQGTVDYLFMNKGESPCEVEVITYRLKKNGLQGVPSGGESDLFDVTNQLEKPIAMGVIKKVMGSIGTDIVTAVKTHEPSISDYVRDPSRPYLPKTRFIDQSVNPFVEVNRVKMCMQSGQRRPFQLRLGGVQYDPANLVKRTRSSGIVDSRPPLFDDHSYIVCIVVNGIAMSRQLSGQTSATTSDVQLTTGPIVGDTYAPADLQWYGTYTENVGAMAYKKVQHRNIFTYGAAPGFNVALTAHNAQSPVPVGGKLSSTPVAMLTQAQAVRVSQTPTQLRFGSAGVSGTEYATSTSNGNAAVGGATTTP